MCQCAARAAAAREAEKARRAADAKEAERVAAIEQARRVAISVARATAGVTSRNAERDAAAADRAEEKASAATATARIATEKAVRAQEAVRANGDGYTGSTRAARAEHRAEHVARVAASVRLTKIANKRGRLKRLAVRDAERARKARDRSASEAVRAASAGGDDHGRGQADSIR